MEFIKKYYVFFAALFFILAGIAIYSNTFHVPFQFDDEYGILSNQTVKDAGDIHGIWAFWPTRFMAIYSFALNYRFGQLNVFGYHAVNLAIHIFNTLLVFWLVRLIFMTPLISKEKISRRAGGIAFFVGLLFLVHPLQTEAVTYIFQRCTSLVAFFYLAALCLYIRARLSERSAGDRARQTALYILSWTAAVCAMLTKENGATAPIMMGLCEYCLFKGGKGFEWKRLIPFALTLVIVPLLLFSSKPVTFGDMQRLMDNPLSRGGSYFLTQFRVIVTYLRLVFIPIKQNIDYDYPMAHSLFELPVLCSLIFLLSILAGALKIFPKYRIISFGVFWFFLALMPESSIMPLMDLIFEHRVYLPMVGLSLALVSLLFIYCGQKSARYVIAALLAICAGLGALTYQRNTVWSSEISLWSDSISKSPAKARPYYNRGAAFAKMKEPNEAFLDYNKAIELKPGYGAAYYNRANLYSDNKEYAQAVIDYTKAIEMLPAHAKAYYNRALALDELGSYDEAIADYTKTIELNPKHAKAYNNRGRIYATIGKNDKAILDYTKAIELNPGYGGAYINRAITLFLNKDYDASWRDVHKAQELGSRPPEKLIEDLKSASGRER